MQRTRVSHASNAVALRVVAIFAVAAAAWPGCNLVPQTLPPDNGLSSNAANPEDAGTLIGADASVGPSSTSSGGSFGVGSGSGGSSTSPPTGTVSVDAGVAIAEAGDAGTGEPTTASDAGALGDAGAVGTPELDGGTDGAEGDGASLAVPDAGDISSDASPMDASDDVVLE
jgi:hypothetical protein